MKMFCNKMKSLVEKHKCVVCTHNGFVKIEDCQKYNMQKPEFTEAENNNDKQEQYLE